MFTNEMCVLLVCRCNIVLNFDKLENILLSLTCSEIQTVLVVDRRFLLHARSTLVLTS